MDNNWTPGNRSGLVLGEQDCFQFQSGCILKPFFCWKFVWMIWCAAVCPAPVPYNIAHANPQPLRTATFDDLIKLWPFCLAWTFIMCTKKCGFVKVCMYRFVHLKGCWLHYFSCTVCLSRVRERKKHSNAVCQNQSLVGWLMILHPKSSECLFWVT